MNVGTKSSLYGVHAFWWHPITVALAWKKIYGTWPRWAEWVAIALHDNYFGCENIDGPEGKLHPARNGKIARIFGGKYAEELVRFHSRDFSRSADRNPSALCAPDKYSVLIEPKWFYMLRAKASGEIKEFIQNAVDAEKLPVGATANDWYEFYREKTMKEFGNCVYLPLRAGVFAKVDLDCPAWILSQKWSACAKKKDGKLYAYRTIPGTKTHQMLHHVILGVQKMAGEVDHQNGDSLDNRRDNLRWCKHADNAKNLKKWSSPTSSAYKGVSLHKQTGKWRAYITLGAKQKSLGCFDNEIEAARAYDTAAKDLFGEFARLNLI